MWSIPIPARSLLRGNGRAPYGIAWNGFTDSTQNAADRIQGFTTRMSYDLAEPNLGIDFKVDSPIRNYDIEIYRLGWYGNAQNLVGTGARLVAKLENRPARVQPLVPIADGTGLRECSNWVVSDTWAPTKNAQGKYVYTTPGEQQAYPLLSGVYYVKLKRLETSGPEKASACVFVLTDDTGAASSDGDPSSIVMSTADATWQAYNFWGNKSLYYDKNDFNSGPTADFRDSTRAYRVSYNRPFDAALDILGGEFDTIQFLEKNAYNVSYITHADVDQPYIDHGDTAAGSSLLQHEVYIVGGHDEYWSGEHMKALEQARINGVSMMFMSGNEAFWKTRWENDYRTITCYKETHNNAGIDPSEVWTGLFRDQRDDINLDSDTTVWENALTGTAFVNNFDGGVNLATGVPLHASYTRKVEVLGTMQQLRLWRNTELSPQWPTESERRDNLLIPLGHEWDADYAEFRPAGLVPVSQNVFNADFPVNDPAAAVIADPRDMPIGSPNPTPGYASGSATHNMTMYRASRDSLVFSAGMSTWSWGFNNRHFVAADPTWTQEDHAVKQATVNILADMGVPPERNALGQLYLENGLVDASPSTDIESPTSKLFSVAKTSIPTEWSFSGEADDFGGGKVVGVEVSADGGKTWKRASIVGGNPAVSVDWTFMMNIPDLGQNELPFLLTRAIDDSFNMEELTVLRQVPVAGVTNLYVYGGSTSSGDWDNDLTITKTGTSFSVKNKLVDVDGFTVTAQLMPEPGFPNRYEFTYTSGYSGTATDVIVQLAIGTNRVTLTDAAFASPAMIDDIASGTATVPGYIAIRGGIGKDTLVVDRVRIGGTFQQPATMATEGMAPTAALRIDGAAGSDSISVTTSVIGHSSNFGGNTEIVALLNGNGSAGSMPVGATVNLDTVRAYGSLAVNTGVGDDKITAKSVTGSGARTIATRGGKDTITRGVANEAVENLFALMGGHGDDTYAYTRTSLPAVGEMFNDAGGSDWLDLSTSPSPLVNFIWPTQFESLRATSGDDTVQVSGGGSFPAGAGHFDAGAGTNKLEVTLGKVYVNSTVPTGAVLNTEVSGGAELKTDRLFQNDLLIKTNSRVTLTPDNGVTNLASKITSLTIQGGGVLDITDNALVIDYGGTSPKGTIRTYILNGRGGSGFGPAWNGTTAITSSTIAAMAAAARDSRSIGYADNSELPLGSYTTFRGVPVDSTCILICYTVTGDANLDGVVNDDDITIVGASYAPGVAQASWAHGDFEYNGFVDDDDVTIIGVYYNPAAQPV
jgi:hypothetical protein